MRLAAIDIGTNSLHMIVVNVRPDLSFEVIDREKEMVRLGAGGLDGRALTSEALHAALQVLSKFRRLAESHRVDEIIAAATSATREAENGGEFLRMVTHQTGIRPRIIAGTEEARLIHMAAVYGVGGPGDVAVVIDIGGGSVEITRGTGPAAEMGRSFKAGVIRLTERFIKSDPVTPHDERKLVKYINAEIGDYLDRISAAGFDRVIGTSGTILSLGAIAATQQGLKPGELLRNRRVSAKHLRRVCRELAALPLDQRLKVPGLEPRRADLAVAGAILLQTLLRRLKASEITLSDLSLREGLVLDYIARHRQQIAQAERYPDVRRRSVVELAERCNYWPEHSSQVARLAQALFDQTRGIHGLTDREREWLEYAALLHDIGVHISYERHHKHSYYLIKNGDLRGFDADEIEAIALIARYHRQATPKRAHDGFGEFRRRRRRAIRTLAAILRLAESLDRSHAQAITSIELHDRGEDCLLQVRTTGDAELELWAATRHAAPFERLLGKPLASKSADKAMLDNLKTPHGYPGKLFVVEGIDGSGKTTQLGLLAKWLSNEGHRVFVTEWNSSALVKAATKTGKRKNALTPMTFSLLHATDFADRLLYKIIPPLKAGMIVLADRYAYTAFARDATRGVERQWVRDLYSFAVRPDLALYFRVPIDVSLDRLMARRIKLKFYEAGLDLGWSSHPPESFRMFQGKVLEEYDRLVDEFGLEIVEATGSITEQQRLVRNLIARHVETSHVEVADDEPL